MATKQKQPEDDITHVLDLAGAVQRCMLTSADLPMFLRAARQAGAEVPGIIMRLVNAIRRDCKEAGEVLDTRTLYFALLETARQLEQLAKQQQAPQQQDPQPRERAKR